MSDPHNHKRDNETEWTDHERDNFIPDWMKWTAAFINRIGFPIFAFCLLAYFYFVGLRQNTDAIKDLRDVMLEVKITLENRR